MTTVDPPCTYCRTVVWPRVGSELHDNATGKDKTVWTCEPCLLKGARDLDDKNCPACADVAEKIRDAIRAHRHYRKTGEMTMVVIPPRVHEHRPGCDMANA